MRVLFIGGTGNISSEVSKLSVKKGIDLHLLSKVKNKLKISGANHITGDINNSKEIHDLIKNEKRL